MSLATQVKERIRKLAAQQGWLDSDNPYPAIFNLGQSGVLTPGEAMGVPELIQAGEIAAQGGAVPNAVKTWTNGQGAKLITDLDRKLRSC